MVECSRWLDRSRSHVLQIQLLFLATQRKCFELCYLSVTDVLLLVRNVLSSCVTECIVCCGRLVMRKVCFMSGWTAVRRRPAFS